MRTNPYISGRPATEISEDWPAHMELVSTGMLASRFLRCWQHHLKVTNDPRLQVVATH